MIISFHCDESESNNRKELFCFYNNSFKNKDISVHEKNSLRTNYTVILDQTKNWTDNDYPNKECDNNKLESIRNCLKELH